MLKKDKKVPDIVGRMSCPICGRPEQIVKSNKNGNLYIFCEARCSSRFSPQDSLNIVEALQSGEMYEFKGVKIRPAGIYKLKTKQIREVKHDTKQSGDRTDGRTDRGHTGSNREPEPRNRLANWLWGDDDVI